MPDPLGLYYRFRRWLWRRREKRFVRDCFFYMAEHDAVYVHLREGSPPSLKLVRYGYGTPMPKEVLNHTHVEGS